MNFLLSINLFAYLFFDSLWGLGADGVVEGEGVGYGANLVPCLFWPWAEHNVCGIINVKIYFQN